MKKMTKVLAILMALVLCFSVVGCAKKTDSTGTSTSSSSQSTDTKKSDDSKQDNSTSAQELNYDITVWVPDAAVELTQKQIADFNATNTDGITLNATVEPVSEADAASTMITDVESGADLYFFAQDQAARLIQAGALSKLGESAAATVRAENASGVVEAAASGDELYAYPLTADNGFFMYYDKSVIPEEDLDDMTKLIADCEAAGRLLSFELQTSAWYIASYFFATGCSSEWVTDDDGQFISINDTFDSANGMIAAKGIRELITSPAHKSSSACTDFADAIPSAIVISGTWDYQTALDILGDNLGATDMPYFTVDGVSYHLGSFNGCKLLGVKPQTDAYKAACVHKLAQYLTSEAGQTERFEALAWGPANTVAQSSEAVQANPGLAALLLQAPYSKPQGQIHGSWWDIAKVIGTNILEGDGSEGSLQTALDTYRDTCAALFNMTSDEKEAWTVIGAINGTNWDTDFPMTRTAETDSKTFVSEAMLLNQGEELKVRQGAGWEVNFGGDGARDGDNLAVPETGYYYVTLTVNDDLSAASLTLEKTSFFSWAAIGTLNGTNWDADFGLEIQEDGTTYKLEGVQMAAGTEFKVRKAHGWTENFGADGVADGSNIVVEADGTYTILFDETTGMITLE